MALHAEKWKFLYFGPYFVNIAHGWPPRVLLTEISLFAEIHDFAKRAFTRMNVPYAVVSNIKPYLIQM